MAKLEDLTRGASVRGILPDCLVTVIDVKWYGSAAVELTYKDPSGKPSVVLLLFAMQMVKDVERLLGHHPRDVSSEQCGYDIESRVQADDRLRFIEVKGRVGDAVTVTVTRNEILTALNKPDDFILAIAQPDGEPLEAGQHKLSYVRQPFQAEPEFAVESINYKLSELLSRGQAPS